jgi:Secretion system C-terminal sorting domain
MKLLFYISSLLILSLLPAKGQILYTDFTPDLTMTIPPFDSSSYLSIDINQDGINDFRYSLYRWYTFGSPNCCDCSQQTIYVLDTNSKVGWVDTLYAFGPCRHGTIAVGATIDDPSLYWRNSTQLSYSCQLLSCFQSKYYIPIKLYLGGNYFFGWIHFSGTTIYDMAINLTPNQPISAAQITTGLNEDFETINVDVYPNPFNEQLNINLKSNETSEIILYDISSRKIKHQNFKNSISITTIELEKGIYIYEVYSKSVSIKKGKIVKY